MFTEAESESYHRVQRRHQAGQDFVSGRRLWSAELGTRVQPHPFAAQLPQLRHVSGGSNVAVRNHIRYRITEQKYNIKIVQRNDSALIIGDIDETVWTG